MTSNLRITLRPASRPARCTRAATALRPAGWLAALVLAAFAACGPEPAEIDRGPVDAATSASQDAEGTDGDAGAPHNARLAVRGGVVYEGPARARCGPRAPRAGEPLDPGRQAPGRLASPGEEPQVGESPEVDPDAGAEVTEHHAGPGFGIVLEPVPAAGLEVTLHLPSVGEQLEVPIVVAAVAEDGSPRSSHGAARVRLDDGATLTRSSATDAVSGSFTGSYRGDAGDGEITGSFERCFYFD